jgi:hypothetical protein
MPTVDNFKTQLRELLSEHSSGISKADLPRLWLEKFGTAFLPANFGHHTLNQLLFRDELKDVLRIKGDTIRQVFSLQVVEGFLQRSRKQLCTNQKHVTISAVIQDTCKQLGVDRWDDLGVGAQHQIRALRTLMDLERKIDTHIASYVAARYRCLAQAVLLASVGGSAASTLWCTWMFCALLPPLFPMLSCYYLCSQCYWEWSLSIIWPFFAHLNLRLACDWCVCPFWGKAELQYV